MGEQKLAALAAVCNRYPNVSLEYDVVDADEIAAGEQVQMVVKLERENEVELGPVHAPYYPKEKEEAWWLLVGDPKTNSLLSIKRVTLQRKANIKLEFNAPESVGKHKLTLFFMCDAWAGCDQDYELNSMLARPWTKTTIRTCGAGRGAWRFSRSQGAELQRQANTRQRLCVRCS